MDLHQKCRSFTTRYMTHSQRNSDDVEMEILKLKHDIATLKRDLLGTTSRSVESRQIHQQILDKWEMINALRMGM